MRIKCDYCGEYMEDTDVVCKNCGAANEHLMRSADGIPKTIDELLAFCKSKNLPLEQMRFFIGIDYKEPRAFGIYKDEHDNFVVYKNKADGTRAIRYRGSDEAYAVNEIYQKMRSEINLRREKAEYKPKEIPDYLKPKQSSASNIVLLVVTIVLCASTIIAAVSGSSHGSSGPSDGYYAYGSNYYYCQNSDWYIFANNNWKRAYDVDDTLEDNYSEYYKGSTYDGNYDVKDFKYTDYYKEYQEEKSEEKEDKWNNDWDDDDDWKVDGGGWDAGDTDWDTDWVKIFDIYDYI